MFNISKTGYDYGISTSIMDGISNVYGLIASTSGELVYDFNYCYGMVLNLEKESTRVIAFSYDSLMAGSYLFRTYLGVIIPVNFVLMGNVFTSLGDWINKSFTEVFTFPLNVIKYLGKMLKLIEVKAPGIIMRESVREPLFTGFIGIDGLLPLGRGQRELIIGDRQTGKTSLAIDIVLNQSNLDIIFLRYL